MWLGRTGLGTGIPVLSDVERGCQRHRSIQRGCDHAPSGTCGSCSETFVRRPLRNRCVSDGLGLHRVPHHNLRHVRTKNFHDRPSIRRGFQHHAVGLMEFLCGESQQLVPTTMHASTEQHLSLAIDHTHLDEVLVNIESDEPLHERSSPARRIRQRSPARAMGIRQLPLRARSSTGLIAEWPVMKPGSQPIDIGGQPPR